jgi:hypothetical protein
MEPAVRRFLVEQGVEIWMMARACQVEHANGRLEAISLEDKELLEADVFVEATGTAGPQANCRRHGFGCAMCVLRCPSWGGRVSIASRMGIKEVMGRKRDGSAGAMSGSCKLHKDSVAPSISAELNRTGVSVVPLPKEMVSTDKLAIKPCQQYALPAYAENLVLLDTGHVKLMTSYYPLEELRRTPGLADARYEDPYAGGKGNSVRFLALSPRDDTLKVRGAENLFCGGEKAGMLVGHTEAICSGTLAGYNAAQYGLGRPLLELPTTTAVGGIIHQAGEAMGTDEGLEIKFTFSGSVYFEYMKTAGLYTTDVVTIRERIDEVGLSGVFAAPTAA